MASLRELGRGKELAVAASAAGVVSIVGLQARAAPVIERARALVVDGYLGRVLAATLTATGIALGGPRLPPGMAWAADRSTAQAS